MSEDIVAVELELVRREYIDTVFDSLVKPACSNLIAADDESGWMRLYSRLRNGSMLCYLLVGKQEEKPVVLALAVLELGQEPISAMRTLNIWNFYGYRHLTPEHYKIGFGYLLQIAESLGIQLVTAVSKHPGILRAVDELGGDSSQRLITFGV